jgi:hypothetical protein
MNAHVVSIGALGVLFLASSNYQNISTAISSVSTGSSKPVTGNIEALRYAIIGQESGGNPKIRNSDTGAAGLGQIMPSNIPNWSYQAIGRRLTVNQFLSSPQLQKTIIDHKLNEYYQRELVKAKGDERLAVRRVASAWYSGNANWYKSTRPQCEKSGRCYPSIQDYSLAILNRYEKEKAKNK